MSFIKSTFFGLSSYSKSQQTLDQAKMLVQNTQFPVVLGFEYYPVVVLPRDKMLERETYQEKGFEIAWGESLQKYSPGQLVIYPIVPLVALKISQEDLSFVLREATSLWVSSKKIADVEAVFQISLEHVVCIDINAYLDVDLKEAFDAWNLYFGASLLNALPAVNVT